MSFKLIWSTSECTEGFNQIFQYCSCCVTRRHNREQQAKRELCRGKIAGYVTQGMSMLENPWWSRYKSKTFDNSFCVNWLAPPYLWESVVETAFYSARTGRVMKRADRWWMDGRMNGLMWDVSYNIRRDRILRVPSIFRNRNTPCGRKKKGERMGGSWLQQNKGEQKNSMSNSEWIVQLQWGLAGGEQRKTIQAKCENELQIWPTAFRLTGGMRPLKIPFQQIMTSFRIFCHSSG